VAALDVPQLEHEPIVFGIRHLRIIECVIMIIIALQKLA
jgi:hypothetical protein